MEKITKIFLNIGLFLSLAFGVWHFFIPYAYKWYSYIPDAPRAITVSVDWINFFFSLFLTGNSLLLIIYQKEIGLGNKGIYSFYVFLVFVWFSRVIITIVHPWNQKFQFIDTAQLIVFLFVFILLFLPMLYYFRKKND